MEAGTAGSELVKRVLSGVLLGAAVLFITWWHPISFAAMSLLGGVILGREWHALTKHRGPRFLLLGALYLGGGIASLISLAFYAPLGEDAYLLLYGLFLIVWAGDSVAYFTGKAFGKHKIIPRISPGKSWEGLAGSIIGSALAVYAAFRLLHEPAPSLLWCVVLGAAFAVIGLLGDLFESSLKRHAGVKDSGRLIPGHGGLFDRVDALLPCAIFAYLLLETSRLFLRVM